MNGLPISKIEILIEDHIWIHRRIIQHKTPSTEDAVLPREDVVWTVTE